jgi:DNA topoisomerase-1
MNTFITREVNINDLKKYKYYYLNSKEIVNKKILDKIYKIYIPPAYQDVKIYLNSKSKVLATGIDSVGRRQYIYSEKCKKDREFKKYCKLVKLSNNFNKLKNKINNDLIQTEFTKNKLIALTLKIIELCNFRGGNKFYEKKYGSYGLTTLHSKHMKFYEKSIKINFIGKKGVNNVCVIMNKNIQEIIKNVYKLSSKNDPYIFSIYYRNKYINVKTNDINKYLEEFNITTKDLRTFNANIIFLENLKNEFKKLDGEHAYEEDILKKNKLKKKIIKEAIKSTSISLHHTPAICKSSYIYKDILYEIENNDIIINRLINENIKVEKLLFELLRTKKVNACIDYNINK